MPAPQALHLQRQLEVAGRGIAPEAIAAQLAAFAISERDELIRSGRASPRWRRFVNGRPDVPEAAVVLPGPIAYEFSVMDQVVEYALAFLRQRSPVLTGAYRASHYVMVRGVRTAPEAIPPGAEIWILSDLPYARKIEVGAMRMSKPPKLYEDATNAVRKRFGGVVDVGIQFVFVPWAWRLKRDQGRRGRRRGDPVTFPALILRPYDLVQ